MKRFGWQRQYGQVSDRLPALAFGQLAVFRHPAFEYRQEKRYIEIRFFTSDGGSGRIGRSVLAAFF